MQCGFSTRFDKCYWDCKGAKNTEIEQIRKRRKKKQFEYDVPEEAQQDLKHKFKVISYCTVLVMDIQSVEEITSAAIL